jgi:hypothetical protein
MSDFEFKVLQKWLLTLLEQGFTRDNIAISFEHALNYICNESLFRSINQYRSKH